MSIRKPKASKKAADSKLSREELRLQKFDVLCQRISTMLTEAGITREELLATLPEVRKSLYARHYGKKPAKQLG